MRHAYRSEKIIDIHKEAMKKTRKPVYAKYEETGEVLLFKSHRECAAWFGVKNATISSTIIYGNKLRGKYKLSHEQPAAIQRTK